MEVGLEARNELAKVTTGRSHDPDTGLIHMGFECKPRRQDRASG
jgi:hypothetical protein